MSNKAISSITWEGPCKGQTELFFTPWSGSREGLLRMRAIKAICGMCQHIKPCREYALKHEEFGVWGGMSEQERRAYRINHNIQLVRPESETIEANRVSNRKFNNWQSQ